MQKKKLTIGIDLGGTNTAFGFIDQEGNYLSGRSILTVGEKTVDKFIERLAENINTMFTDYKDEYNIAGIGIAAPSANYLNGTIETPSNLQWGYVNFVSKFKKYFNVPIAIINDASAAALGEFHYGHTKGLKNFIVITLGTGVGAGIFVDGNLLYGERGLAGELGHIIVEPNGRKCNCGREGCLETFVSASGLKRTVFELMAIYNDQSKLRDLSFNQVTGKMVSDLAANGDPIAVKAFEITGEILGKAMVNLAAYYSPELIVLFGGLVNSGNLLLNPVRRTFESKLLNVHKGKIKVLISALNNGTAAVLGASKFILKEMQNDSLELDKKLKIQ